MRRCIRTAPTGPKKPYKAHQAGSELHFRLAGPTRVHEGHYQPKSAPKNRAGSAKQTRRCPLSTATSPGSRSLAMPCRGTAAAECRTTPTRPQTPPRNETPVVPAGVRARAEPGPGDGGSERGRVPVSVRARQRGGRRTARPRRGPLDTRHPVGPLFIPPHFLPRSHPPCPPPPTAPPCTSIRMCVRRCTYIYIHPSSSTDRVITGSSSQPMVEPVAGLRCALCSPSPCAFQSVSH